MAALALLLLLAPRPTHIETPRSVGHFEFRVESFTDSPQPRVMAHLRRKTTQLVAHHISHHKQQEQALFAKAKISEAKATKTIFAVKPPPQTEQLVAMKFKTPLGRPVAGLKVKLALLDKNGNSIGTQETTTSADGDVKLTLKKFPVVVKPIVSSDEWALQEADKCFYALKGTEAGMLIADVDFQDLYASMMPFAPMGDQGKKPQKNQPRIIHRNVQLPDIRLERKIADVDIQTEPGTVALLGDDPLGTADASGKIVCSVPLEKLGDDAVDIRFHRENETGKFDGSMPMPKLSPYDRNTISAAPLRLSSINSVEITGLTLPDVGTFKAENLSKLYGKPKVEKGGAHDGFSWMRFKDKGIAFRVRAVRDETKTKGKKTGTSDVVERIRITSPAGGNVGGVTAGTSMTEVRAKMGPGGNEVDRDGVLVSYLDAGLVISEKAGAVDWIEIRRPTSLIQQGVDLTLPDHLSRIYIEPIEVGTSFEKFPKARQLATDWLSNLPGYEVTSDRQAADLILKVKLASFEPKAENLFGAVPLKYEAIVGVDYRIVDAATGKAPVGLSGETIEGGTTEGKASADYKGDVAGAATAGVVGEIIANQIGNEDLKRLLKLGIVLGGVAAVDNLKKTMSRASERCKPYALRNALQPVLRALADASDLRLRVLAVDAIDGTVTLGGGRNIGLKEGAEFEILNGLTPAFDSLDTPLKQTAIIARVTDVTSTNAVCKVVAVERTVNKNAREERAPDAPQTSKLLEVMDPSTCMVQARRVLRLQDEPDVDVKKK